MGGCNRYDDLTWLFFARNQLASEMRTEMESHADLCNDCRSRLIFFRKLSATIDLNSSDPPPAWIEEAARKFERAEPSSQPPNVFGELLFDSYLHEEEPVRSGRLDARHLTFDFPAFELDLALEYSGGQLNLMMGHLLTKESDTPPSVTTLSNAGVELRVATRTYTTRPNTFGEFCFSVDTQMTAEPLELRCTFQEGPCAIVLIPF